MNYILLAISSLQFLLAELLPNKGASTAIDALIADVEAAIAKLQAVHGTDVTWQQLNDLRLQKQW